MNVPRPISDFLPRSLLGGLFIYAGVVKIADPVSFAGNVAAYKLLPYFGNYLMASTLPFIELACGVLLVLGVRIRASATLVTLLTLVFMAALVSTIARGLDIDCGCFRHGAGKTSAWQALGRDALLLVVALHVRHRSSRS